MRRPSSERGRSAISGRHTSPVDQPYKDQRTAGYEMGHIADTVTKVIRAPRLRW